MPKQVASQSLCPDNPRIAILSHSTTKSKIYPVGSKIWSKIEKKVIPSKYSLVEAWQELWKTNTAHSLKIEVVHPKTGDLRLLVRAALNSIDGKLIATPESGTLDQQGFPVDKYTIRLHESPHKIGEKYDLRTLTREDVLNNMEIFNYLYTLRSEKEITGA